MPAHSSTSAKPGLLKNRVSLSREGALRSSLNLTALGRAYSERGINDNNEGDLAGFADYDHQCPGREWLCHRGDHPVSNTLSLPNPFQPRRRCYSRCTWRRAQLLWLLFALGAIYKQATPALPILGALAVAMQMLDAGIGLFEHDPGKCVGPLFIDIPNSSWCICFPDPGRSRRKPTADKRKLRRGISKFAPAAQVKPMQRITRPFISLRDNLSVGSFSQFDRSCSPHTPRAQLRSRPAGG